MIYKLTFTNGRIDWCTAKDELHLLKSYDSEFDLIIQDVEDIQEITTEEAKTTMISNLEYVDGSADWTLFELATSDQFSILATNEPD